MGFFEILRQILSDFIIFKERLLCSRFNLLLLLRKIVLHIFFCC